MIKKGLSCLLLVCGFWVSSCDNISEDAILGKDAIEIQTHIGIVPRIPSLDETGKGNFVQGDVFSIVTTGEGFQAVTTDYEVGTTEMTWSGMNIPSTIHTVNFAACYPRQTVGADGTFVFDLAVAKEKDLLLAKARDLYCPT